MATTAGTILIPVLQSTEVIEVQISELPDDVGEVLEILMNELAPLEVWLRFAVEYYRQGKHDSFLKMFQPLLDEHARGNLFDQFGDTKQTREQFLAILNALAAFHTVMGSRERDKTKKKAEFEKAKRFYDSAEGVDLLKGSANVGRAVLQLAKGQLGAAEKTLTEVDAFNRNSVPALLGKACAKYNSGNARDALKLYREVFRVNPQPPPTVRLGLAYCYHKLGQARMAQKALERTLALQEDCVEAMVGLAVIHLNDERVEEALVILKRAYELEPYNPSVLNHLASHFFYKGQYQKAQTLAKRAYDYADAKAIKAESAYHLARCAHASTDYKTARAMYLEATRANPDYLAPQFGLGQMLLENDEAKKAVSCFERVIKADPANVEALKVLGHLYAKEGREAEALKALTKATEHDSSDAAVWLELAKLQQRLPGQLANANKSYEKAAGLIKKVRTVPAEIWNNLGAIRHRLGKLDMAELAYGYAIKVRTLKGADEYDASCISTQYNLGRLYEDQGELQKASDKYLAILRHHPTYLEAFLRLTAVEDAAGRPLEAIGWANKAHMVHPRSADALCQLGNLYLQVHELKKAEGTFGEVKKLAGCEHDTYATCQLGWIQLLQAASGAAASAALTQACSTPAGAARVDKATELFRKALELEPNNVYAANGIGVVCVAKGRLHEAMQIFTQVREASSSCEHATLNLAQLNAALLEHATAASLYEAATKRVAPGAKLQQLRLLRARNLFEDREYLESRKVLQSLVCDAPELQVGWHNLGLAYLYAARHPDAKAYEHGIDVPPPRSVEVVRAAQVALEHARCVLDAPEVALLAKAATVEGGKLAAATASAEGEAPQTAAQRAAAAALAANVVGRAAPTTKAALALGLTAEHREKARNMCDRLGRELRDELERAEEAESKFRREAAEAEAIAAALAAEREAKAAAEVAKLEAEKAEQLRLYAEQKAKLAAKLDVWREADLRDAEAAKEGAKTKRKRKEATAEEEEEAAVLAAARAAAEEEDDNALFGSDDDEDEAADDDYKEESEEEDEDEDEDDEEEEEEDKGEEGEEGNEETRAARKAAKAEAKAKAKAEKKAEKKAAKKAAAKEARREAKRAAKDARKAEKDGKAARRAAMDAAAAGRLGAAQGGDDEDEADLFGSDGEDAAVSSAPPESGGGGGRLIKKRKVAEVDDEEDGEADGDGAEADLFGADDDEEGAGAGTEASEAAAPKKRKAVVVDDEDD